MGGVAAKLNNIMVICNRCVLLRLVDRSTQVSLRFGTGEEKHILSVKKVILWSTPSFSTLWPRPEVKRRFMRQEMKDANVYPASRLCDDTLMAYPRFRPSSLFRPLSATVENRVPESGSDLLASFLFSWPPQVGSFSSVSRSCSRSDIDASNSFA